jgi:hypothetical protein
MSDNQVFWLRVRLSRHWKPEVVQVTRPGQ